jgi:hypothetical protein
MRGKQTFIILKESRQKIAEKSEIFRRKYNSGK